MTVDVQLKRALFIFVVVIGCIKATVTFMPSSHAPRNLFHDSMWVSRWFSSKVTPPWAIEVKDVQLPDSFQESQ